MVLTPEEVAIGRRNFIKAMAGAPPLLAFGAAAALRGRKYEDWREMLAKEDLEAVLIATPLWCHAEMTVGCLEAGKHVKRASTCWSKK